MLKKSFLIVLIQATGMILSLVSVYLVAGDMGPGIYSLLGINAVVTGIVGTFSHYVTKYGSIETEFTPYGEYIGYIITKMKELRNMQLNQSFHVVLALSF